MPGRTTSRARPLAKYQGLPFIWAEVAWKVRAWKRWSWRLSPTGRSATTSIPWSRRCSSVADAGQHQQLRRAHEATREDDLLGRAYDAARAVLVGHLDTGRTAVLDDDAPGEDLGLELEGRRREIVDVAAGGAVAQAVGGVLLHPPHPLLRLAVVVVEDLDAEGVARGLEELQRALLRELVAGDPDRAARAAVGVLAVLEVLHPLVGRVDLVGRPAGVALSRPGVVVGAVAAHVDHAVDRARAADHLPARHRQGAVEEVLLRRRVEAPVDARLELRHRVHRPDHPRLRHEELPVGLAGLQHDHPGARLRQPAGDRGPGAAGTDHDVLGLVGVRLRP